MRVKAIGATVLALALLGAASGAHAQVGPGADAVVAREAGVQALYALDETVLYRTRRGAWRRVVGGRPRAARRMPEGAAVQSIGRNRAGRVAVTVHRGPYPDAREWWTYDVAGDRARFLGVKVPVRCRAESFARWRGRLAYVEACGRGAGTVKTVVLRAGGRTQRFAGVLREFDTATLALGPRSLGALVYDDGDDYTVVSMQDRGRRCVRRVAFAGAGEGPWYARGLWIGAAGLEWAMARGEGAFTPAPPFTDLAIMTSDLTGACPAAPVQRVLAAPSESMRAVAVDGRWLYYATATAIHRRLLAARASTAPPANDDWQQAVALDGPLPLHAVGRVGHATAQPGESALVGPRSVWYAFRPAVSGRVSIQVTWGLTFNSGVFTGTPPSALTQLAPAPFGAVDVVAGQTYWIVVYGYGDPTYEPFTIDIAPTG